MRLIRDLFVLGTLAIAPSHAALPPLPTPFPATTAEGYALPQPGHAFTFPEDHGAHPDFRIEWWYLTGHLQVDGTPSYGFQATFFRQAGESPDGRRDKADTSFGFDQIYLAHMALVDLSSGKFYHQEKLNRAGWDAFAREQSLDLRNGNWSLRMPAPDQLELVGGVGAELAFQLKLEAAKPLVVFGENSISRKGAEPRAASYYLTYPRLVGSGKVSIEGTQKTVTALAWMDHEISSSQLGRGQVGWDWISIQFQDQRELMLYRLRLVDGSSDPASKLTWVDRDGQLQPEDFSWTVHHTWTSPHTGAIYPREIELRTIDPSTGESVTFLIKPLVADQELSGTLGGIAYWEGACQIVDPASGQELGRAYMELTGYTEALAF